MTQTPRRRCVLFVHLHPSYHLDWHHLSASQFKQIAIAYQVLSDPDLRKKYNMMGQKNGGGGVEPSGGFQDPEEVFGSMFGGERFHDLIGTISIGK
jgi:DnaJ-class molecular chaperone